MFTTSRIASLAASRLPFLASRAISSGAGSYSHMVVNAVGSDRPGIVADLTKIITEGGGNIGDSRSQRLGSHFSVMMLVSTPSSDFKTISNSLQQLNGVETLVYETSDPETIEVFTEVGYAGSFTMEGADSAGIVHKITSVIANHGLSLENLDTSRQGAPFGGTTLFSMSGIITAQNPLASNFDPEAVREELQVLGDEMNCDIGLHDIESKDIVDGAA